MGCNVLRELEREYCVIWVVVLCWMSGTLLEIQVLRWPYSCHHQSIHHPVVTTHTSGMNSPRAEIIDCPSPFFFFFFKYHSLFLSFFPSSTQWCMGMWGMHLCLYTSLVNLPVSLHPFYFYFFFLGGVWVLTFHILYCALMEIYSF